MSGSNSLIQLTEKLLKKLINNRMTVPHVFSFIRYNSIKKLVNLIKLTLEIKRKHTIVNSKPIVAMVEITNICNLRCPFCLTGKIEISGRKKANMTLTSMKKSIDAV